MPPLLDHLPATDEHVANLLLAAGEQPAIEDRGIRRRRQIRIVAVQHQPVGAIAALQPADRRAAPAKLAGTERGITAPTPTFSACFGAAFLTLHPTQYAEVLVKRMEAAGAQAYLVNTGWNGSGKRISIKDTRGIIDAILNGDIEQADTFTLPIFGLAVPTALPGVDPSILDPRKTYADESLWQEKAQDLAQRFIDNFAKYTVTQAGEKLVNAGPKL